MAPHKNSRSSAQSRRLWLGLGVLLVLCAAAAAWKWTPLSELIDIHRLSRWAAALRDSPARHFYLLGAYIVGSILLVPITAMILVTAMIFGPFAGSVYALVGSLAGAAVTYAIGAMLGRDLVRKIAGRKWQRLERKINATGIIAVTALRLLPVAPFTVVNIVCGAFKVPWRDYLLGSILGLTPGVLITALFAHQLAGALRNPGIGAFVLLAALIVVTIVGSVWLKRRLET